MQQVMLAVSDVKSYMEVTPALVTGDKHSWTHPSCKKSSYAESTVQERSQVGALVVIQTEPILHPAQHPPLILQVTVSHRGHSAETKISERKKDIHSSALTKHMAILCLHVLE